MLYRPLAPARIGVFLFFLCFRHVHVNADAVLVGKLFCADAKLIGVVEYRPQAKNIQAMLRVINAKKALEMYAELNPDKDMVLRVEGDADIPMNNAYYVIKNGKVRQTDEPYADALKLTINGLAEFLFDGVGAEMNLMLN